MRQTIIIGEIVGVHGIRGEIKIKPLTDDPGRFYDLDAVDVVYKGKRTNYEIEMVRLHKENVLLSLCGLRDRDAAEKLKGAMIEIDREEAVELEEDEYFITDLIGLQVIDPEGVTIGIIRNVLQTTGAVDTLEIKTAEKILFVPFRKIYFPKIDFEKGIAESDIPDDLMNL